MADRTVVVRLVGMVGQYRAALAEATAATNALGAAVGRANAQSAAAMTGMARSHRRTVSAMSDTVRSMRSTLVGFGMPLAVGLMFKQWMDFERQMAHVAAVTSDAFGRSDVGQRRLRESALRLGQAYGFTATEVGQAQEELAKAGRNTLDVLGGDLNAALTLAAAGTIKLDESAKLIAVSMTQFEKAGAMMGDRTIKASQVADLLARSANATVSDVSAMGTALSYVGPQAASLGMSLEETVTTLALFNQAGIDGDMAGTNLRGMLTGLMSPSRLAREEMNKLGLSIFDASGEFVGMAELADRLQDKLSGKTAAEQQEIIGRLTTNAAMPGFITLLKAGAEGWELMRKKIAATASAEEVARAKLNSLAGDVDKLTAAMSTSSIKVLDNFNTELRAVVTTTTDVITGFGEMGPAAQLATLAMLGQLFVARRVRAGLGTMAGGYRDVRRETADLTREQARLQALQNRIGFGPGQVRPGFAAMSGVLPAQIAAQQRAVSAQAAAAARASQSVGVFGRIAGQAAGVTAGRMETASSAAGRFGATFAGAMRGATAAASGLMGVMGGPWGAALMVGLGVFAHYSGEAAAAKARIQDLGDALTQLGGTYRKTGSDTNSAVLGLIEQDEALTRLIANAEKFGLSQRDIIAAAGGQVGSQAMVLKAFEDRIATQKNDIMKNLDSSAWTAIVGEPMHDLGGRLAWWHESKGEKLDARLKATEEQRKALEKSFENAELMAKIDKEAEELRISDALDAIGEKGTSASEGIKAMALNLQAMSSEGAKVEDVLKASTSNLQSMASAYLSVSSAQAAFRATTLSGEAAKSFGADPEAKRPRPTIKPRIDFVTGQFASQTRQGLEQHAAAEKMAKAAFDLGTAAKDEAFVRMPKTMQDIGAAGLVAVQQFKNARDEFVKTYTALGMNVDAANRLADSYGLIPSDFAVQINAVGADQTISELNRLGVQVRMIPSTGEVVVTASTEEALRKIVGLEAKVERDPITGQVKYVFPSAGELGAALPDLKPVEVPVVPKMQFGSANAAEHWMASQKEASVTVKPTVAPVPPIPDAPITLDPTVGPTPPVPNAPITLDPQLGPIPSIPPRTMWITPRLTAPIPSSPAPVMGPVPPRWGAVHSYAAGGIHAKVGRGDLIRWAEPETGGEAYIPRLGDRARSKAILDVAAGWYGYGLHKMAAGGLTTYSGGVGALPNAPFAEFFSRYMDAPDNWLTRRTDATVEHRDALIAVKDAEAALAEVRKDSKATALDLAKAQNALADSRRQLALANTQLGKARLAPRDQFKASLDMGVRNTASFIANLNAIANQGYGALAMQLLAMGGPEAEAIAAGAKSWPASVAARMNKQAELAQKQQKTLESMPAMLAIRGALKKGQTYDQLLGSGVATDAELNAALEQMRGELSKTPRGRAMLAAMTGGQSRALSAALRGYPTGIDISGGRAALAPTVMQPSVPAFSKPAGAGQVQITVRGEGVISGMIEATVDGRLVTVAKAVNHGSVIG